MLRFFSDPVGQMLSLHREFGPIAALADGSATLVCAFGSALNRHVLSQPALFENSSEIPLVPPPGSSLERFNRVLPFTNGEAHRRRRRLLLPAFQRSAIEGYLPALVDATSWGLDTWPKGKVDLASLLRRLTAAITLRCLFGVNERDPEEQLGEVEARLLEALSSPLAIALPLRIPGTPYQRAITLAAWVEDRLRRLIAERRRTPGGSDALSILLGARDEDGSALSDDELVGECNGLFVAGYDTSAQTLAWTVFLLLQHPEVFGALLEELATLSGPPTAADLPRLGLLDRVVRESMRLLPAAPMLFVRVCAENTSLGEVALPKGARIVLSPLVTHRNPGIYPDPMRFNPARWEGLAPTPWEYLPFGAGARMCLGSAFAGQLVRVVLAMLLRRFRIELADGAEISRSMHGIALAPKKGIPVSLGPYTGTPAPRAAIRGDIREIVTL